MCLFVSLSHFSVCDGVIVVCDGVGVSFYACVCFSVSLSVGVHACRYVHV